MRSWVDLTLVLCLSLLAVIAPANAAMEQPRRVLILHSFGHDFAPFSDFTRHFRAELTEQSGLPHDFSDVSVLNARRGPVQDDAAFIEYLMSLSSGKAPDLVVTVGGAAVRFVQRNRSRVFPDAPMMFAAVDQRVVDDYRLTANDTVLAVRNDFPGMVSSILQVLPNTRRLVVVLGDSPIERFWVTEMRRDLQPFADRLDLVWFNELSFEEMKRRAASLPSNSAILYALLAVDAAGVPNNLERSLGELKAVSNAPIFGLFESQLGAGIVGGRLISNRALAIDAAGVAVRILRGATPGSIEMPPRDPGTPVYDWRELQRWNIREQDLPTGSVVRFRAPTIWARYGGYVIAIVTIITLQAVLIAALLVQSARRRRAESEAIALSGRLITAHEDERRRLGRELHDDMTQRLARLAIDAARIERNGSGPEIAKAARAVREELVRLSEDVHALSYRLHPSVIEDLGLVEALRAECDSVSRHEALDVSVEATDVPQKLPLPAAVCLYRVAQEALRNSARHARASAVVVSLDTSDGGLQLKVKDNGAGFDHTRHNGRTSLGQASMRERVRLLGGKLDIESAAGHGTTVTAWIPLREAPL
jgi:signal transduction histidine kinase